MIRAYERTLVACGALSGAAIGALAVMISLDVTLRNLGIASLPWLLEVSEYVLFITTFIAAPWVLALGKHVRVDLIFGLVPGAAARAIEAVADTFGLAISLILFWYGARITLDTFWRGDWLYKELVIPEAALLVFIPFGSALLSIEFIRRAHRAWREGPADTAQDRTREGF